MEECSAGQQHRINNVVRAFAITVPVGERVESCALSAAAHRV